LANIARMSPDEWNNSRPVLLRYFEAGEDRSLHLRDERILGHRSKGC
jgi:uncharacterized protein YdaU (DUF1376 family)